MNSSSKTSSQSSRSALVTGASQGIGQAICERLSQEGWSLILVSRRLESLKAVAAKLKTDTLCLAADLNDAGSAQNLVEHVRTQLKNGQSLKALINNAGAYKRIGFLETTDLDWEEQFNLNLMAPIRLCRAFHPLLSQAQNASIINISSTVGLKPVAMTSAYSAMKAALNSLTLALASEFAPQIRVNAICPGIIDTPIHDFHKSDKNSEERKFVDGLQPLKRMGRPQDIAAAVNFLVSEDSAWTTGTLLTVDGGIQLL